MISFNLVVENHSKEIQYTYLGPILLLKHYHRTLAHLEQHEVAEPHLIACAYEEVGFIIDNEVLHDGVLVFLWGR